MKKLKSIILAGGSGTRLKPLTCDLPKPLAPICGSPCIYYILNLLKTHGSDEVCLTLRYKSEEIAGAVEKINDMKIHCVEEKEPLGTAGSVANCKKYIDDDFFVICGDCICDFDLTKAAEFHKNHGGIATIILTKVKEPLEYGVAVINDDNKITRFIEKPAWSRAYSDTVNTGIYIFSKKIFEHIPDNEPCDFSKDIFPKLMEKGFDIYGYIADGYWCDIGNISAYMTCNKDVLDGKPKILPKLEILLRNQSSEPENADIHGPVFIGQNVSAENAYIGPYSVIGNNCVLGKNVKIENSILLDGVKMEDGSSVRGCVICGDAVLKKDVSVGEQSVIGSYAEIGKSVIISAGSKIYPKNIIPEDSFIKNDVIDGIDDIRIENGKISIKNNSNPSVANLVKIGSAFAAVIKNDIAFGVEINKNAPNPMAAVMALCSGMISATKNTFDLGECDINIFSFAVREYGFGGGLHISAEQDEIVLTLLESDGLPFGREKERSFESALASGEINTVNGEIRTFKGYKKIYEKHFAEKTETLDPIYAFISAPDFISKKIKAKPKKENCEYIYVMPQRLIVQTKNREAYDDDLIKCVTAFCCGMNDGEVFIPYDYPAAIDSAAKKFGFRCVRLTLEDKDRVKLYKITDTYYKALYLFSFMAKHGLTFAEIAKNMPVFTSRRREIEVTADKAAIMRTLSAVKGRELVEGVKIREKIGTVLIIPQKNKNAFNICAESEDAEIAAELCDFYAKKLKK